MTSDVKTTTISQVEDAVRHYYPVLLPSVKACLAVCAAMALTKRTKPLSLIFETTSGYGKTATVQMIFPLPGGGLVNYVYRTDKFTPKAFVSHAANIPRGSLSQNDLLPKLQGKVLVTKELAPIFRGREEELQDNFSTLIAVLDGKGFTSDSGMHGKRGYEQSILFNWVGATTPLPVKTHRLMHQLGTRLLFYEVPSEEPSEDELMAYGAREDASQAEEVCQEVVNEFLLGFFAQHPVGSAKLTEIPEELLRQLVRWARFLAKGRAEVMYERDGNNWTPVAAAKAEGPYKIVNYFKDIVRGHALIHDRAVNGDDLGLVGHIAVSSLPRHLRAVIQALRREGAINSSQCAEASGVRQPTARRYLEELSLLGIVDLKKESPPQPYFATLVEDFQWLTY